MTYKTKPQGFSLIEVMLAVLVLSVGILAVSKLQGTLIRNGSDANQRTVAASIAQRKIDDIKSFSKLKADTGVTWEDALAATTPQTEVAYNHITSFESGTGGLIPPSNSISVGPTLYSLSWNVEDYWHTTAALSAPTITEPTPAPATSDFKNITVTVGWVDETGTTQSISLDTVVDAYAPSLTELSDNSQNGGTPPSASYTPGVAPDIVHISLDGGDKRESTAPQISVSQNNQYVEYDFSVITYDSNNNILKQEDLRQINCTCEQQASDSETFLPVSMELADNDSIFINKFDSTDFKVISGGKNWGAPITNGQDGQQSDNCDICCRDHHDKTGPNDPDTLFDPFRPTTDYTSGDHNHYYPDNNGQLQLANDDGDLYLEACLLVKVDGIFRVAQDLNLLTVKTMPESYLLGSGFTQYKNYKEDYLLAYAKQLDSHDSFPAQSLGHVTSNTSIKYLLNDPSSASAVTLIDEPDLDSPALSIGDTKNLRAKTLYARYIPSDVFNKLKELVVDNSTTWLDISRLVPFYDPDGTLIAQTNEDTSAWGTDEPSQVTVDQSGLLTALSATSADGTFITATRADSTTGFTNTRPIDPNDGDSNYLTSDEMVVVVSGTSSSTPINQILTITSSGNSAVDPKSVSLNGSSGASCGLQANNVKYVYICSFSGGAGVITISDYNGSSGNGNNATVIDNKVCLATSGAPTITVANDGAETETSTIIYSGLTNPTVGKRVHIALATETCPIF